MSALDETKKQLRKQAATARKMAFDDMPDAPVRLAGFATQLFHNFTPKCVAAYWPIRTEIDPIPLLGALADLGASTCLPATPEDGKPLRFHEWACGAPLVDGPYHTKEPSSDAGLVIPDLILAPLLAFDSAFWRLGYGGGFYDRTLAALEQAGHQVDVVGIAFDESLVNKVPTGPYDRQLSAILTPSTLRLPQS